MPPVSVLTPFQYNEVNCVSVSTLVNNLRNKRLFKEHLVEYFVFATCSVPQTAYFYKVYTKRTSLVLRVALENITFLAKTCTFPFTLRCAGYSEC